MSNPTDEKSDIEKDREALLRTYIQNERNKAAELQKKKNPSLKQRMFGDMGKTIRGIVEKF